MNDRARLRCLSGQRISPRPSRAEGFVRRCARRATYPAAALYLLTLYGLAAYGALALWHAW
jgi:hypothetical protein